MEIMWSTYIHLVQLKIHPPSYIWQDAIHSAVLSNIIGTLMLASMADTAARYAPLVNTKTSPWR